MSNEQKTLAATTDELYSILLDTVKSVLSGKKVNFMKLPWPLDLCFKSCSALLTGDDLKSRQIAVRWAIPYLNQSKSYRLLTNLVITFNSIIPVIMTDKESEIIFLRYRDHKSLREIGEILGITSSRVRQLEMNILFKLQLPKNKNIIETFTRIGFYYAGVISDVYSKCNNVVKGIKIQELKLSVRPLNCLKKANITTIGELTNISTSDLFNVCNHIRRIQNEIIAAVHNLGFKFKDE